MTGRVKNIADPTYCHDGVHVLSVTSLYCPDFITDSAFSLTFSHDSTAFATDPTVVRSVIGSVPVETHHYRSKLSILLLTDLVIYNQYWS